MTDPAHLDVLPDEEALLEEVLVGLRNPEKRLPSKLFYDETGSRLFDSICELEEYYPTRTETGIMRQSGGEMAERIGAGVTVLEYGSGSSTKTRVLLEHLDDVAAYVPLDISREHLLRAAAALQRRFPRLRILPLCADYTADVVLPADLDAGDRLLVYFPGSTIGNFEPAEAVAFLRRIAGLLAGKGGLLIGVDLRKDVATLERAYNDERGVTAAFNLNALRHLNRRFGANFVLARFSHRAFFNEEDSRVEMHLESLQDQEVRLGDETIFFRAGETIHTESSYKYTLDGFAAIAAAAGLDVDRVWTDPARLFSVQYLVPRTPFEAITPRDGAPLA
jgi:dimethylhistidine N-methyltransferase